jgi:hypothetical protein
VRKKKRLLVQKYYGDLLSISIRFSQIISASSWIDIVGKIRGLSGRADKE